MLTDYGSTRAQRLVVVLAPSVVIVALCAVAVLVGDDGIWPLAVGTAVLGLVVSLVLKGLFEFRDAHRTTARELRKREDQLSHRLAGQEASIDHLEQESRSEAARLIDTRRLLDEERVQTSKLQAELGAQTQRLDETRQLLDQARGELRETRELAVTDLRPRVERVEVLSGRTANENSSTKHLTDALTGRLYQQMKRSLDDHEVDQLIAWAETLDLEINERAVRYLEHRVLEIEARCRGRLATTSFDMAARAITVRAAMAGPTRVLEIGTLFGVSAAMVHDVCSGYGHSLHQVLIDPLDGYYGASLDPMVGLPVTAELVRGNMQAVGASAADFEVVRGLSTDPASRAAAGTGFDVVIIDGDHTGPVVTTDYQWAVEIANDGGFIVFDDYQADTWPDVTQIVDDVVKHDTRVKFVGAIARMAVFRREFGD